MDDAGWPMKALRNQLQRSMLFEELFFPEAATVSPALIAANDVPDSLVQRKTSGTSKVLPREGQQDADNEAEQHDHDPQVDEERANCSAVISNSGR